MQLDQVADWRTPESTRISFLNPESNFFMLRSRSSAFVRFTAPRSPCRRP